MGRWYWLSFHTPLLSSPTAFHHDLVAALPRCDLLRLSRLCYRLFAERVSFELVNSFFDAAGARFWGLGTFDRYGDRLFFAVG